MGAHFIDNGQFFYGIFTQFAPSCGLCHQEEMLLDPSNTFRGHQGAAGRPVKAGEVMTCTYHGDIFLFDALLSANERHTWSHGHLAKFYAKLASFKKEVITLSGSKVMPILV